MTTSQVLQSNLNIRHIRTLQRSVEKMSGKFSQGVGNSGGATIVYKEVPEGIEYAVSYCSPRDNFSRLIGRSSAVGRYNKGHTVVLKDCLVEQFEAELEDIIARKYEDNSGISFDLNEVFGAHIPATYTFQK